MWAIFFDRVWCLLWVKAQLGKYFLLRGFSYSAWQNSARISLNFCALLDYQWTLKISFNPDPNNLLNSQRLLIRFNFAGIALLNIILIFSFQEEPLSPPYKRTPPSKSGTYLDDHLPSGPKHSAARMNFHQWISIPSFSPWPQQLQAVAKKLYEHNVISNLIHFWKVACIVAWRLEGGII